MRKIKLLCLSAAMVSCVTAMAGVSLTFDASTKVDLNISSANNEYTIVTTGGDPHVVTSAFTSASTDAKLQFEYQASADIDDLQLFFRDPESEARSMHYGPLKKAAEWTAITINVAPQRNSFSWGGSGSKLRFDFGNNSGITIKIRNLALNGRYTLSSTQKNNEAQLIERYLASDFYDEVENVEVTDDKVIITGHVGQSGCKLMEVHAYGSAPRMTGYTDVQAISEGEFRVETDRYITIGINQYDRLLSKWAIVDANHKLISHARYADKVPELCHAEPGVFKSKKGIGGLGSENLTELDQLGLGSVTVNILLSQFMATNKNYDDWIPYEYQGRTYWINPPVQNSFDALFKECEKRGVIVAAIILISPDGGEQGYATTVCHPEYDKCGQHGFYTMPNVTDIEGVNAYAAAIDYLASRYSTPGNGRIHHWIMHNEVDQNKEWTNMGDQPMLRYVDTYEKSMRIASNIIRQYDPNAYVMASFTSSWCTVNGDGGFAAKAMLDNLVCFSKVEGDFRWGVAAHPYPQNFFKPKFWTEDTGATYSENSGYSTFKNIEVISDWMLRPEHYYKGKEKRMLFFSENGVNSMDNSSTYLNIQAAGAAWAWKKVAACSGVDAVMWHNWRDNPAEGICLGLRYENNNPKPSWYVWQAAGTDKESSVLDQYLSVIGVSSWDQIFGTVQASGENNVRLYLDLNTREQMNATYDGTYQYYTLATTGGDAKIYTSATTQDISDNSNVLAFDYKSNKDIPEFQVFFSPLSYEELSVKVPLKATTEWRRVYLNISAMRKNHGWGGSGSQLRIDPGDASGVTFQIRHICVNSGAKASVTNLRASSAGQNQCTLTEDVSRGEYTVVTSGGDPGFYTWHMDTNLNPDATNLVFEYQSNVACPVQVFFVDHAAENRSIKTETLPATSQWKRVELDIADICKTHGWGFEGDYMRIDPGSSSGITFKIRNIGINTGEYTSAENLILDNYSVKNMSLSRDANPEPEELYLAYGPELAYISWTANTTGTDPYVFTAPLDKSLNDDATKIRFDYKSTVDISELEMFFEYPESSVRSKKFTNVMPATDEWKTLTLDVADIRANFGWGYAGNRLRIDLGNKVGATINLRNLIIYNGDDSLVTEVESVMAEEDYELYGTIGGIVIKSAEKQRFTIYNIMGTVVRQADIDGEAFIPLVQGIYIVNGHKIIVR